MKSTRDSAGKSASGTAWAGGGQSRWVGGMAFTGDRDTVDGGMGEEAGCASCLAIPMYTAMLYLYLYLYPNPNPNPKVGAL